ncbi:MAG: amidohydrolase family protein, partial [Burkholderiaceae bacterium]
LLAAGITEPLGHAMSRPAAVEREATHRAISLAEVMRVPILLVHVSAADAIEQIRWAHGRGLRIYGETCPQYLFLTEDDLALDAGGARCICSPPPRDQANQQLVWDGLANGAFEVLSSDHAPFRSGADGKAVAGPHAGFHQVPNGIPGLETRLALLMSEGVNAGRIDIHRFVALTSTQAAKLYGLHPRKGTLAVGSDADMVVWHDAVDFTLTNAMLHHAVDYTPYEGMRLTAWPALTLARGEVVWQGEPGQGEVCDRVGRGQFVSAALSPMAQIPRRPGARHHWLPKG